MDSMVEDYCLNMKSEPGGVLRELPGPVLITGHTGFKGVWLTLLLEHLGIDVVGYSLPPEDESLYKRLERKGQIPETFANILDSSILEKCIAQYKPSVVFHLAAQPLVMKSYEIPIETFQTNVIGTANVLNAAISSNSVIAIGAVTTDKVYKNLNTGRRFIESDPLEGKDPYSASKVGSEAVITAFQNISELQNGPKLISLRAGNVIGGGDYAADRLIPDLVRAVEGNKKVFIRNPNSTRPWQHVLDPVFGYMLAIESAIKGNSQKSYNFGPTEASLSVREVVKLFQQQIDVSVNIEEILDPSSLESHTLELSSELARNHLSWQPRMTQEEAIRKTFDWWKNVLENEKSALMNTKNQIDEYLQ
jgi:CDP-glucose 4,6-dehydratase